MAVNPIQWARSQRQEMSTAAKLMLVLLADNHNDEYGYAWPSIETLAADAGVKRRRVFQALNELYELGLIRIEERRHEQRTNRYYLLSEDPLVWRSNSKTQVQHTAPGQVQYTAPGWGDQVQYTAPGNPVSSHNVREAGKRKGGSHGSPAPSESQQITQPAKPKQEGSRLPDGWQPTQAHIDFALSVGLSEEEAHYEAAKFRDYWCAIPGQRGRKRDWFATWRNWVRKAASSRQRGAGRKHAGGNRQGPGSIVEAARQSVNARRNQGGS